MKVEEYFSFLEDVMRKARMKISLKNYLRALFISIAALTPFFLIVFFFISSLLKLNFFLWLIISIYLTILVPISIFLIFILLPYHKLHSRKKSIEANLPFALVHMASIARSGVPPYIVFKLVARFKEYGELAKEMEEIAKNIEVRGMEVTTAVKKVLEKTPSPQLREVLSGYVTTITSGGDIKTYLRSVGQQALFEWRLKRQRFIQQLTTYSEFYVGLVLGAPIFIITLFAVLALVQPKVGGFDILYLTKIAVYGLIPLINVFFMIFLKGFEIEI